MTLGLGAAIMIVELVLSAMPGAYPSACLSRLPASARADALTIAPLPAALVPSVSVPYEVRASHAEPRALAAVRGTAAREQLGTSIIRMLDLVWPVLRGQGVRTGHNVVVYFGGLQNIAAGVEVFSDFTDSGEVQHLATPSGEVAMATHYGEYSEMRPAYAALEQWLADHRRRPAGVSWEVYGDWEDDPAKRRTDVYFLLEPEAG